LAECNYQHGGSENKPYDKRPLCRKPSVMGRGQGDSKLSYRRPHSNPRCSLQITIHLHGEILPGRRHYSNHLELVVHYWSKPLIIHYEELSTNLKKFLKYYMLIYYILILRGFHCDNFIYKFLNYLEINKIGLNC
jgi:hypothetical protein